MFLIAAASTSTVTIIVLVILIAAMFIGQWLGRRQDRLEASRKAAQQTPKETERPKEPGVEYLASARSETEG